MPNINHEKSSIDFRMTKKPGTLETAKYKGVLSHEERMDLALLLLNDIRPIQKRSDEADFGFLSYLLQMAILEAQDIASGSNGESDSAPGVSGDSSDDASTPGGPSLKSVAEI